MVGEVRKTLVWGTTMAAVASAMLLTSNGGGMPRIDADTARARGEAAAPPASARPRVGVAAHALAAEPAGSAR